MTHQASEYRADLKLKIKENLINYQFGENKKLICEV
jgi:hypothetical protein